MRNILMALFVLVMPAAAMADDRAEIAQRIETCQSPIDWSIFDVRYQDRYTHVACSDPAGGDQSITFDFRMRLSDGQLTLFKAPLRGRVSFPVHVDGPILFWLGGNENALFRLDQETGVETLIAPHRDAMGRTTHVSMVTPGDNGFHTWRSEGDEFYARRLFIDRNGVITDLGGRVEGGPVVTLPQQFDAPAVSHLTEGEHFLVKKMYATVSGTLMFDEAFFAKHPRIQTSGGRSQFFASRDGTRVVGVMAAGLFEKDHPDYPRGAQVVMIDKARGIKAHKVDRGANMGLNDAGISSDGRYFWVKVDSGFEVREFWTEKRLFKFAPKNAMSGNPGDIHFVSDTQVVVIDGNEVPHFFTFTD